MRPLGFVAAVETVASKPAFREAFKQRRSLIAVSGYCEWKEIEPKVKQPHRITLKPKQPFSFAGLWERWQNAEKIVESCRSS